MPLVEIQILGLSATTDDTIMLPNAARSEIVLKLYKAESTIVASNISGFANDNDAALGDEIEMLASRGPAPMIQAPRLEFTREDGLTAGSNQTNPLHPGLLFVFPSSLMHGMRPYRGEAPRISIAMHFGLCPKATSKDGFCRDMQEMTGQ